MDPWDEGDYVPYHPDRAGPDAQRLVEQVEGLDRSTPVTARSFGAFTLLLHHGFRRINYATETRVSDGAHVWLSRAHAQAIGRALGGHMEYLALSFTAWEGDAPELLAASVDPDLRVDELVFSHKSADAATLEEARGLARLATTARARVVRWWSGEFVPGALDTLGGELERLVNGTVVVLDVCDITLPEPEDRIRHPALERLVRGNRQ